MIAAKVANALALDYPRERLQVIVACDGSPDDTAERAREAGADLVLDLPRGGKVARAERRRRAADPRGELLAFSDANASWEPGRAARARRAASPTRASATSAARSASSTPSGGHQPGGRSTGATRCGCASSSRGLARVTAGNGAIYAVRREAYLAVDPVMGHDLSFPFNMVKRGRRAVYAPRRARGEDGPVDRGRVRPQAADDEPRLADRPARRDARRRAATRRSTRWMIASHRAAALRRAVPARRRARRERRRCSAPGRIYRVALAASSRCSPPRRSPARVPVAPAARRALLRAHDRLDRRRALGPPAHGTPPGWAPPEGTR